MPEPEHAAEDPILHDLERQLLAEPDISALLGSSSCHSLQRDLRRFLDAKNGDMEAAFKKACNYYRWTINERPDRIGETEIGEELDSGKLLYLCDDLLKRPVFLVQPRLHYAPSHTRGFPRRSTKQLLIAAIRYAVSCMPSECDSLSIIADMRGFTLENKDTGVLKDLGGLLAKYFPGRLHQLYIANPPQVLWVLWRVIRPLIDKKWMDTIQFLTRPDHLLRYIAGEELPVEYGGVIVPDWHDWVQSSKEGILGSKNVTLHAVCRRGRGEKVPPAELAEKCGLASQVSDLELSDSEMFYSASNCSSE